MQGRSWASSDGWLFYDATEIIIPLAYHVWLSASLLWCILCNVSIKDSLKCETACFLVELLHAVTWVLYSSEVRMYLVLCTYLCTYICICILWLFLRLTQLSLYGNSIFANVMCLLFVSLFQQLIKILSGIDEFCCAVGPRSLKLTSFRQLSLLRGRVFFWTTLLTYAALTWAYPVLPEGYHVRFVYGFFLYMLKSR